jgi:ubiquinone/menaquinone biosynthesis C-methylase UbiE
MWNEKAEFDEMAENLDDLAKADLGIFAWMRESILDYKGEYLKYLLPENTKTILDYGCGSGLYVNSLRKYFPKLKIYGCDVSGKSIEVAKKKHPDCEFFTISNVSDLNIFKDKVDCVFINCVLHHIPHSEHKNWITGLYNNMKEGSYLVIFEMNMNNPLSRRLVNNSPIDKNAEMLKPTYCKKLIEDIFIKNEFIKLSYCYSFPWRTKILVGIEHQLSWLPLGAQYYLIAKK